MNTEKRIWATAILLVLGAMVLAQFTFNSAVLTRLTAIEGHTDWEALFEHPVVEVTAVVPWQERFPLETPVARGEADWKSSEEVDTARAWYARALGEGRMTDEDVAFWFAFYDHRNFER